MSGQATMLFPLGEDRRRQTTLNRLRRCLNDYWVIPVLFCYLQLATQVIYPAESPLNRLSKGNRAFFQGIPIAYNIATQEFPFTMLGHLYELGNHGLYKTDLFQVPHETLRVALNAPGKGEEIYNRLVLSRDHHESEWGGLLTVSYHEGQPELHLYEVSSLNEDYLERLRSEAENPSAFLDLVTLSDGQEVLDGVGIEKGWVENITSLIKNDRITEDVRKKLIKNFTEMYEALSESRYLLSPYQFKGALGKIPFDERFVGLFHFHNGLNERPSPVDMQQSLRKRQIVMTFSEEGWTLYDVVNREMRTINIKIDKRVALQ